MSVETGSYSPIPRAIPPEGIQPERLVIPAEKVRVLIPYNPEVAHYNAGVIGLGKSDLLILVREVPMADVRAGTPDKGNLLFYRSTPDKVEKVAQLDLSDPRISHWEDPRAFISNMARVNNQGVETGEVLIGMTAIKASDNKPVAATVRGNIIDGNFSIQDESLLVYPNDRGKNVTPISLTTSLFRREGSRHSLEVVEHDTKNGENKLKVVKTIQFPKRPWCQWQIGTQAQILPGGILPIHGVNRTSLGWDRKTRKEVFGHTYSMGLAQLDRNLRVTKVTDTPLFTRQSFENILPMGEELDPNKDVIYCCGYSVVGDAVNLVISIGDLMTVATERSMFELRRALDESSPIYKELPRIGLAGAASSTPTSSSAAA